jgi:NADPH:quinone reductase-like Zn-dependent oxidoreductase
LKPVVDEVFSFTDPAGALRRLQSASHFGKLVTSVTH